MYNCTLTLTNHKITWQKLSLRKPNTKISKLLTPQNFTLRYNSSDKYSLGLNNYGIKKRFHQA